MISGMPTTHRIDLALRIASLSAVALIVVLSVVPGSERPHVLASGNAEHFCAYAGSAFLLVAAFRKPTWIYWVIGLALLSSALEIAQLWIPGRSSGIDNALASSCGALFGALGARSIVAAIFRR